MRGFRVLCGLHHRRGVGHVDAAGVNGVADLGRGLLGEVAVEVPDLDRGAGRGEALDDRLADPWAPPVTIATWPLRSIWFMGCSGVSVAAEVARKEAAGKGRACVEARSHRLRLLALLRHDAELLLQAR